jgi:hypothetical protein
MPVVTVVPPLNESRQETNKQTQATYSTPVNTPAAFENPPEKTRGHITVPKVQRSWLGDFGK